MFFYFIFIYLLFFWIFINSPNTYQSSHAETASDAARKHVAAAAHELVVKQRSDASTAPGSNSGGGGDASTSSTRAGAGDDLPDQHESPAELPVLPLQDAALDQSGGSEPRALPPPRRAPSEPVADNPPPLPPLSQAVDDGDVALAATGSAETPAPPPGFPAAQAGSSSNATICAFFYCSIILVPFLNYLLC
jgi:hypothetical protein